MSSSPDGDVPVGYGTYHFLASRVDVLRATLRERALDMAIDIEKFFSEAHRQIYDRGKGEGKAEGEAKGKAEALLMFCRRPRSGDDQ